ncbi:MAG: hypothetical protein AVDCRST_MAG14-1099, partial [uncultured Rubrobacteraceae bacterium]
AIRGDPRCAGGPGGSDPDELYLGGPEGDGAGDAGRHLGADHRVYGPRNCALHAEAGVHGAGGLVLARLGGVGGVYRRLHSLRRRAGRGRPGALPGNSFATHLRSRLRRLRHLRSRGGVVLAEGARRGPDPGRWRPGDSGPPRHPEPL